MTFVIEIRQAMPADVRDWAKMRHALWPAEDVGAHERELRSMPATAGFVGFIAFHDKTPVGFAEASIRPFANGCDSRPVPFLEGIWVAPEYRRKGISRKFIGACEDWARSRGFREMGSDSAQSNAFSLKAHGAWGFHETERVVYFRKKLD
jgi:aminoglycoside 6'-N-acetyltransferase I